MEYYPFYSVTWQGEGGNKGFMLEREKELLQQHTFIKFHFKYTIGVCFNLAVLNCSLYVSVYKGKEYEAAFGLFFFLLEDNQHLTHP